MTAAHPPPPAAPPPLPDLAVVLAASRRVAAEAELQEALDRCAGEAAALAGYRAALLTLTFDGGTELGLYGLSPAERRYFLDRRAAADPAERRLNRARLRDRCYPGTSIAFLPHATTDWHVLPSPRVAPGAPAEAWHPDDTVFLLVHDARGQDVGVLSLDAPVDGLRPTGASLPRLELARALVDQVVDLLAARHAAGLQSARLGQAQRLELLGRVAHEVAHDLNNVLTAVVGLASLAGEQAEHPELLRLLASIEGAGQRAGELARRLLCVGRLGELAPHAVSVPTDVDLDRCMRGCLPLLEQLLAPGQRLEYRAGAGPLRVRATELQVVQVVLNLVVNARDATLGEGVIELRVGVGLDDADPVVAVEVQDRGVGMCEEVRRRALEPSFTTKAHGSGLGLATVHGITTLLGGTLHIDSSPGAGTTVRVVLPRA